MTIQDDYHYSDDDCLSLEQILNESPDIDSDDLEMIDLTDEFDAVDPDIVLQDIADDDLTPDECKAYYENKILLCDDTPSMTDAMYGVRNDDSLSLLIDDIDK